MRYLAITTAILSLSLGMGCRATATTKAASTEGASLPIRSQAQLDHYLSTHDQTPFDALSPGARERLFESLSFTENGVPNLWHGDLANELDYEQTVRILRLFGTESHARIIIPGGAEARPTGSAYSEVEGASRLDAPLKAFQAAARAGREVPAEERTRRVADAYRRLFPRPDDVDGQGLTAQDLRLQLIAARAVVFHQPSAQNADEVVRLVLAIERVGSMRASEAEAARSALVALRRFDEAAALAQRFRALLAPLPATRPLAHPTDRSVWAFDDSHTLVQRAVPQWTGTQVIVMGSTGCHATRNAAEAIDADPELQRLLAGALWLLPSSDPIQLDHVQAWEQRHPWAPLQFANKESEWPELGEWLLPTFVFVKDGQVQAKVTGWPPEGRKSELLKAAAEVGLSPGE